MKYLDINLDYEKYFILSVTKLNAFLLSQIIMAVGIALDLTSLQFKKREYLVTTLGVACILTSIHFALLQQQTAALMFLLAAIRHFVSLKSERVNYRRYQTRQQAKADIIDYIEPFYNQKRRHHKLGNISPVEYEMKLMKSA